MSEKLPTERMFEIGEMAYRRYREVMQSWGKQSTWLQLRESERIAWAEAGLVAFNMGVHAVVLMKDKALEELVPYEVLPSGERFPLPKGSIVRAGNRRAGAPRASVVKRCRRGKLAYVQLRDDMVIAEFAENEIEWKPE